MNESVVAARVAPFRSLLDDHDATLVQLALAVSSAVNGDVDVEHSLAALADAAAAVDEPTPTGIVESLFGSGRFVGDASSYHHRDNSCLDRVLERRRGMPITLSVVAIEVGRRLDVPIIGVGLPGHFVIGSGDDPDWFADPFRRGVVFGRDGCHAIAARFGQPWSDTFLEPVSTRMIITRILNNLLATSTATADTVTAAIVLQLRAEMPEFESERPTARRALHTFN